MCIYIPYTNIYIVYNMYINIIICVYNFTIILVHSILLKMYNMIYSC